MKIQSQAPITDQASFYDEEEIYLNTTDLSLTIENIVSMFCEDMEEEQLQKSVQQQ